MHSDWQDECCYEWGVDGTSAAMMGVWMGCVGGHTTTGARGGVKRVGFGGGAGQAELGQAGVLKALWGAFSGCCSVGWLVYRLVRLGQDGSNATQAFQPRS